MNPPLHRVMRVLAAALVAVGTLGGQQPWLSVYDAARVHPQCSQGPAVYMKECVFPTDYFSYVLSADPRQTDTSNCTQLGYEYVMADPSFPKFDLYWKGGAAAFAAFRETFGPNHEELTAYLNAARDDNPACNTTSTHPPPRPTPVASLAPASDRAVPARPASTSARPRLGGSDGSTMTSYDHTGALPQCAEGPTAYMTECVAPVDFVAFLKSAEPTRIPGSHCTSMGYAYQGMDNIFPQVRLYWKKGTNTTMQDYFGAYFKNHSEAFGFLNYTRDRTKACVQD